MPRWLLLVLVAVVLLFVAAAIFFVRGILPLMEGGGYSKEPPPELKVARVVTGAKNFSKVTFFEDASLRTVSDIRPYTLAADSVPSLAIVGEGGARFLGENNRIRHLTNFSDFLYNPVVLADIEGDGNPEFLHRGSWGSQVNLFDSQGRKLWGYDSFVGVDDSAAGDVDGDGRAEIVVGFNGGGGVHLLTAEGRKVWDKRDGNVWRVEIVDVDGDGRGEILHSNAHGELTLRNASGEIISRKQPMVYVSYFALLRWGSEAQATHVAYPVRDKIYLFTARGDFVREFPADFCDKLHNNFATQVNFSKGLALAFLTTFSVVNRSILYVHDAGGELLFHEVIADSCNSIAALPAQGSDRLLVGCTGIVWEYVSQKSNLPAKKQANAEVAKPN